MFEQSTTYRQPTYKHWTVFASFSAQTLFVAAAIAVPLVFTDQLPQFKWVATITAPAPIPVTPPSISQARSVQRMSEAPPRLQKVFVAPSRVPDRVDARPDDPSLAASAPPTYPQIGVPFTAGANSVVSMFDNLARRAPPLPQPPPVHKVEKPSGPIQVGGRVQAAKLTRQIVPAYPALAKSARISGVVRLQGIIGKDGAITNLQLISGHPLLVQAALDAVRQWVYKPTLLNGEPVEVIAPIDVIFTLNQ